MQWIKSTDLNSLSDGSTNNIWPDASGNNHDLTQGVAAFFPRYYRNLVHGQAVVRFEQANNRLIRNAFSAFPSNQITRIIVNRNNDSKDGLLSYAVPSNNNESRWYDSSRLSIYRKLSTNTNTAINGNKWTILPHHCAATTGPHIFIGTDKNPLRIPLYRALLSYRVAAWR